MSDTPYRCRSPRGWWLRIPLGLAAAVLALLVAACGGSSTTGTSIDSASVSAAASGSKGCHGHITHLTVDGVGITTDGIIPLAAAKGFFAQHCVSVTRTSVASPAAALANLIGGSADIAYAPSIPVVNFAAKGAPIRVLAPADGEPTAAEIATRGYKTGQDLTGIFVKNSSSLHGSTSLEGQSVSVPALSAQLQVVASWAIKKAGGDPSKVHWVVLDFPTALSELEAGKIAAVGLTYPFSNSALAHGSRLLVGSDVQFFGVGSADGMWTTTAAKWASDQKALAGFRAAVIEANRYADTHWSVFAPYAAKITAMPLATVKSDSFAIYFPTTATERDLNRVASNMVYAGFLTHKPNLSGIVLP